LLPLPLLSLCFSKWRSGLNQGIETEALGCQDRVSHVRRHSHPFAISSVAVSSSRLPILFWLMPLGSRPGDQSYPLSRIPHKSIRRLYPSNTVFCCRSVVLHPVSVTIAGSSFSSNTQENRGQISHAARRTKSKEVTGVGNGREMKKASVGRKQHALLFTPSPFFEAHPSHVHVQ
jgi:hypothetical protein